MSEIYDFHPPGWIARVRRTPIKDVLRWQWTARLDPRTTIAAGNLPAPLPGLIYTVVRRSRLWRSEQHDVARELIAHFADGLTAGRSAEDLTRDFGSPRQAARLIGRAKRRNRPLWWQAWRVVSRLLLAAIALGLVFYVFLAVRFYLGSPLISHNYWHEINAARRVPDDQRAWPLYREAIFKLGKADVGKIDPDEMVEDGPSGKKWNEAVAILERHQDALALIRQGAAKPRFGYYLGDPDDLAASRKANGSWAIGTDQPLADENQELIAAPLPGVQESRTICRLLAVDARVAAVRGDGATAVADLEAMISLSEQIFQPQSTLVEQLVGYAIFSVATYQMGRILAETPAVFSDEQLKTLAHRFAAWRAGQITVDFNAERMMFDDILQRVYTNDGQGNGRMTPQGMQVTADLASQPEGLIAACIPRPGKERLIVVGARLISPGVASVMGSREENHELYHSMVDDAIAAHQGPSWQWNEEALRANRSRLDALFASSVRQFRYYPVNIMLPALEVIFNVPERMIQFRNAIEVAISLELWRRRHGGWPERLDLLVPDLLPAVPLDRTDGQPLRYVVRDGQAVVYSPGRDRQDDGGLLGAKPDDAMVLNYGPPSQGPREPEFKNPSDAPADWILWPPPKPESEPEDESDPEDE